MRGAKIAGAGLLVLAFSGSAGAVVKVVTIDELNLRFKPDTLVVHVGDIVQWVNPAGNIMSHTSTSGTGSTDPNSGKLWDLGLFAPGTSVQHKFGAVGNHPYYCKPHELSGMKGKIVVVSAVPSTGTGANVALVFLLILAGGYAIWRRQSAIA